MRVMPGGIRHAAALLGAVVVLVVAIGCSTHRHAACAPDQLLRCVPGLADLDESIFDGITVYSAEQELAALPPSADRESAPEVCKRVPRLGGGDRTELQVTYRPATDAKGIPVGNRFPQAGGEYVHLRLTAAPAGFDISKAMTEWASKCRMWGFARVTDDQRLPGWLIAQSDDKLKRYQSGDTAGQWPYVTHTAAKMLVNGVVVQAWYRTNDPSAESRRYVLSHLIDAAGRTRSRAQMPPKLEDWSPAQITTLLPALSTHVTIDARAGEPGGQYWSLCQQGDHGPEPLYDTVASWRRSQAPPGDRPGAGKVEINRARSGVDYLSALRSEIDSCTAHLGEVPALCGKAVNRQFLKADPVVTDGQDSLRILHRWMRVEKLQGYDRCTEGVEAIRVAQVRGLIVISRDGHSSYIPGEQMLTVPMETLDELLDETVRKIKPA